MTEKEIAEKIRQAASAMAKAVKNGYSVSVRNTKDGVMIYRESRDKLNIDRSS